MALNCGCNNGYNRALNDKAARELYKTGLEAQMAKGGSLENLSFIDRMLVNPGGTAVAAIGGAGLLFAGLKLAKKIR